MIPRVVHQTWFDPYKVPSWFSRILERNQRMNPEMVFQLWGDRDIDSFFLEHAHEIPPIVKKAYFRINPHYGTCRADIFRYVLMYVMGGIYMDLKIVCREPFSSWIDFEKDKGVFSYWWGEQIEKETLRNKKGELQNWFLVFEKGDPRLRQMILHMSHVILRETKMDYQGKRPVLFFTGPLMYTKYMEPLLDLVEGYRVVESWKYLDYGNSFHEHSMGKHHYSKLTEPLFLKNGVEIPSTWVRTLEGTHPHFLAGLYLYYGDQRTSWNYRIKYPLSYLCQGVDYLLGYGETFFFFGSADTFHIHQMMHLRDRFREDPRERIEGGEMWIKLVTVETIHPGLHLVMFHHQVFLEIFQ